MKGFENGEGPYKVLLILGGPFMVKSSLIQPVKEELRSDTIDANIL